MEAAVVGAGRHAGHSAHFVEAPRGEDEQAAVGAGLEALALGLPIRADGLLLYVDEREAALYALVFHQQLAARDAGRHDYRGAAEDGGEPLVVLLGVVGGGLVGLAVGGVSAVALHLHLVRPAQQEEVAEGAVAAAAYLHMEAALHEVGQSAAQDGAARVVVHIGNHGLAVAVVEAHGVVVVVIEQRAALSAHKGVVFLALLFGEASYQRAFVGVFLGFFT